MIELILFIYRHHSYYKLSKNAEKSQEKFEKMVHDGGKSADQLQKEQGIK